MSDIESYFSDSDNDDNSLDEKPSLKGGALDDESDGEVSLDEENVDDESDIITNSEKLKTKIDSIDNEEDIPNDSDDDLEIENEDFDIEQDDDVNINPFKNEKEKQILLNSDEDDDDDDDDDENYLQRFDQELTKQYINEYHPECIQHNYEEISIMSKVIRDKNNNIIDPYHKTIPFLTKYEKTRILGQRAKQIECGSTPLVKVPETVIEAHIIAELELEQKRIPFIVKRPIPNGGFEYWNLQDLEIIY